MLQGVAELCAANRIDPASIDYLLHGTTTAKRAAGLRADLRIMASNGGVATPAMVAEKPVMTLLSGLAAGVLGAPGLVSRAAGASSLPSTSVARAPTSASSSTAAMRRPTRAARRSPASRYRCR